ncbi:hypothetical protein BU25DRAFT_206875 [Macroventuria anomochaeta]|uniref:Uncharacterized protein n=1 Tax=Macroventuria anomochaeta TaxID=301207 RepID=A0ACB6RL11_9PLEO|nr:uncharacterized protein BU25DRAFT_206875 [Macroventuria anomochaeta]KAF2622620.1 hypothetical protein BU25DRAFT_206875 [Macroventuria anomochaeta]
MIIPPALLCVLLLAYRAHALPTTKPTQIQDTETTNNWSIEAILGLISVFVALLCCAIGLVWPSCRRRLTLRRIHAAASRSACSITSPALLASTAIQHQGARSTHLLATQVHRPNMVPVHSSMVAITITTMFVPTESNFV